MTTWIYLPVPEAGLKSVAEKLKKIAPFSELVEPPDQGNSKAVRRFFGGGLLKTVGPLDTVYVVTHGSGDFETVSTHAVAQREPTAKELASPRLGIGEAAETDKFFMVYYRCGACTRVDRYPGNCAKCHQATAPWNQKVKLYIHKLGGCGRTQLNAGTCVVCGEVVCPNSRLKTKSCRLRCCVDTNFRCDEITEKVLAPFFKAYSPTHLAESLQKEGLPKTATDVRAFSCGSGTSAPGQPSYAQRLYENLVRLGYKSMVVLGYKGEVSVDEVAKCIMVDTAHNHPVKLVPRDHVVRFPPHKG